MPQVPLAEHNDMIETFPADGADQTLRVAVLTPIGGLIDESPEHSVRMGVRGGGLGRLDHKTEGSIIVVMQRLHPDDLVGHLLEQAGWTHLNLPAIAEEDTIVRLGPNRSHRRRVGDLLHPERRSRSRWMS